MAVRQISESAKKIGKAATKGEIVKMPKKALRSGQRAKVKKPRKSTAPTFIEAADVQERGDKMIAQDAFRFRALAQAKILYLRTTADRIGGCLEGKVKAGRYPRMFRYKAALRYEFLVLVSGPSWDRATDEERTRLVYHALRHMGSDVNGRWRTEPHDIEGFVTEVEFFGLRDARFAKIAEQLQLFDGKSERKGGEA